MTRSPDAVVIGAGVMGGSIALELARSGLVVAVVDKAGAAGHGSTSASSAIVRFNYSTRDGVATSWESKHCWQAWPDHLGFVDETGLASFQRTGMAVLDTPVNPRAPVIAHFDQIGVPYEQWDAATLRRRIAGIDAGAYWPPKRIDDDEFFQDAKGELGALFMPDAGFIDDPQLAAHNLIAAAQRLGTRCVFNATVTEVVRKNGRVAGVRLADGTRFSSPVVVNAAGPWSSGLNRLAGVGDDFTIVVRPMRQEVHYLDAPHEYSVASRFGPGIADMDLGTYMRPAPGNKLMVGGTEPACDPLEWIDDPDDASPSVTSEVYARQTTRAARRLTSLAVPVGAKGVAGVYDVAEDWTPIYDRTELDGYYVAMGTSGNQFKNAPVVGRIMALLIERVEAGHDHDNHPVLYVGEHTGNAINLGAFSRKRPFNARSTGTVMG
jgi:glycine/D-amino acid oxidase-like deaminating enzyme